MSNSAPFLSLCSNKMFLFLLFMSSVQGLQGSRLEHVRRNLVPLSTAICCCRILKHQKNFCGMLDYLAGDSKKR